METITINKPVHQLFKAFASNANRVQNKQKLYDELRDLIQKKKIQGKKSIKEMLEIPNIAEICSQHLLNAISMVVRDNVVNEQRNEQGLEGEVQIEIDRKDGEDEDEEDEEDEDDYSDEDDEDDYSDEDDEDEEEDDEEDPDYDPMEDEETRDMRKENHKHSYNTCDHTVQRDTILYACNHIRDCMDKIVKASYRMNGIYHIKYTDIQGILANVDMLTDVINTVLNK
jgi:hypothetical protein